MAGEADFNRIWDGAVAFFQWLNAGADAKLRGAGIGAACLALAQRRDAQDGTNTAAPYLLKNPSWRVDRGEIDEIETLAPIARVDKLDWIHDEFDGAADNLVQNWRLEFVIGLAAYGADRDDAIRRFEDAASVFVDAMMGDFSYLRLDRALTGLERAGLTGGRWATSARGDQYLCSGFKLLRCRVRWSKLGT